MAKYPTINPDQAVKNIDKGMSNGKNYASGRANEMKTGTLPVSVIRDVYVVVSSERDRLEAAMASEEIVSEAESQKGAAAVDAIGEMLSKTAEIITWIESNAPDAASEPTMTASELSGLRSLLLEVVEIVE